MTAQTQPLSPQQVLEALTGILRHLDGPRFRIIVDAPDDATDLQILEAMHKARIEHPGISRKQKANSRVWLGARSKK